MAWGPPRVKFGVRGRFFKTSLGRGKRGGMRGQEKGEKREKKRSNLSPAQRGEGKKRPLSRGGQVKSL